RCIDQFLLPPRKIDVYGSPRDSTVVDQSGHRGTRNPVSPDQLHSTLDQTTSNRPRHWIPFTDLTSSPRSWSQPRGAFRIRSLMHPLPRRGGEYETGGLTVSDQSPVLVMHPALGCRRTPSAVDDLPCSGQCAAVDTGRPHVIDTQFERRIQSPRREQRMNGAPQCRVEQGGRDPAVHGAERIREIRSSLDRYRDVTRFDPVVTHADQPVDSRKIIRRLLLCLTQAIYHGRVDMYRHYG